MISVQNRLALCFLATATLSATGCGGDGPPSGQLPSHVPVTHFLAGFRLEGPQASVSRQQPFAARIETGESSEPAIFHKRDFDLSIHKSGLRGALLRGRYGLLDRDRADRRTQAVFRVRLSTAPAEPGRTLFEASVDSASPVLEAFSLSIPDSGPDAGYLSLEVSYRKRPHRRKLTAAWVNPVLVTQRPLPPNPPPNPWNVVLITSDTTRQDVLSCYGGSARTPALERLAADGVTFTNAFSVAFGTTPSHASLLTASQAADHGVYDNQTVLGAEQTTLQEILQERAYATAAFVSARPLVRSLGFAQGFDLYDDLLLHDSSSGLGRYSKAERRADVTAASFLDWLDRRGPEPFFSWVHFFDPHQPYAPPPGTAVSASLPDERREELMARYFRNREGRLRYFLMPLRPPPDAAEIEGLARALYRAEIEAMDRQIGRILAALEDRDLYRRTLIVFVADHGENFLERGRKMAFRHSSLFSEVSRLPLIVKLPRGEHAGTTRDLLLGNLDVAPTILDVLGLETPDGWNGRSFLPLLAGGAGRGHRPYLVLEGTSRQELAVRTTDWMYRRLLKPNLMRNGVAVQGLAYEPGQESEIYDLLADPSELTRAAPGDCPECRELSSIADRFLADSSLAQQGQEREQVTDPEHLEALKALGYVD